MKPIIFILCISLILSCFVAYPQDTKIKAMKKGYSGVPSYLTFNTNSFQYKEGNIEKLWEDYLKTTPSDKLEKIKSRTDKYGMEHQKFQQYYKGIKVEGGLYVLHLKNGVVSSANGNFIKVDSLEITPKLTGEEAVLAALDNTRAKLYAWESEGMEAILKQDTRDTTATYYPKAELVIWHPYRVNMTLLAYKVEVYSLKPLIRDNVYIDAKTGKILDRDSRLRFSAIGGGGDTRYSGSKGFTIDRIDATHYRLLDPSKCNNGIHVWDLNESWDIGDKEEFINGSAVWSAEDWDNEEKDNAALDALWALENIYVYFHDTHGWDSYDGNNSAINCYVHYGAEYANAFWDGSEILLGDGDDINLDAVASLDIVAHEFAHGINTTTCNLASNGISGAIDESLSDIWGAVVEFNIAQEKEHWETGEEIALADTMRRVLDDPHLYYDPDTYGDDPFWGSDSHINSGVMNYWFYLLSDGDSGVNSNDDEYDVEGLGDINDAAAIVFQMEACEYLNSDADFDDARVASIQAASDLSLDVQQVVDAWYAVGVGQPEMSGPSALCSTTFFEAEYIPSWWDDVIWMHSNNITLVSDQGATCSFSPNGSAAGWIQAKVVISGSDTLYTPVKNLLVGVPVIDTIDGASTAVVDEYEVYHVSYDYDCYPTDFYWGAYPYYEGLTISPYSGYDWTYITFPEPDDYTVLVQIENYCGMSSYAYKTVEVSENKSAKIASSPNSSLIGSTKIGDELNLVISPNPSTGKTTISLQGYGQYGTEWELEVYDPLQNLVEKITGIKQGEVQMDIQNLAEGVYFVRASVGGQSVAGKLVVKK